MPKFACIVKRYGTMYVEAENMYEADDIVSNMPFPDVIKNTEWSDMEVNPDEFPYEVE